MRHLIRRTVKVITIGSFIFWLTSCATISEKNLPQNQPESWKSRVKTLSELQTWDLNGTIGIRNNTKNANLSANIKWHQQNKQYSILLFGPLGAGAIKLIGQPGLVKLENSDGKVYTATSPERLIAQQANWYLPVSNLYYWIRGLPVPNLSTKTYFDSFNHLTALEQQGWHIQFLNYTSINHIDIPTKIILSNQEINVKIVIHNWKLPETTH